MKVVLIVPGSGGAYYCENCLRDVDLLRGLRRLGVDAVMVPMYLPMLAEGIPEEKTVPVFFGGINVWLQQRFPLFRHTPRWLDRIFDARWLLRRAAAMEGTTDAAGLGPMTLSMLVGGEGNQRKEVERLVAWLAEHERPDVVHISNALLAGMARDIKAALDVPVVCSLQDEDTWLDRIEPPFDERCWNVLAGRCADIDRFVSVSAWYADRMSERLMVPRDLVDVVHVGIDIEGCGQAPLDFDPPVLGYLSRMNAELGLGRLVDAFIELKRVPALRRLKLRATGGMLGNDRRYVAGLREKLAGLGLSGDAEFIEDFSRAHRQAFIRSLSVMHVPTVQGEAYGSYIIEALAAGVPVVQPAAGAFPELVDATGGGLLYESDSVATLQSLLCNPELARQLGHMGMATVHERFGLETMARNTVAVYKELVG